jgi:hypothetical protein
MRRLAFRDKMFGPLLLVLLGAGLIVVLALKVVGLI